VNGRRRSMRRAFIITPSEAQVLPPPAVKFP
jgi:hypothetical protein